MHASRTGQSDQRKGMYMVRTCVFVFLIGIFAANVAVAQCRGGGGQGGSTGLNSGMITGTTGTTTAVALTSLGGGSSSLLTGPGSLAYDMMMAQMVAQRVAQQQAMIAMQQQKVKAEKLAARKYRAEQTRSQVAASRERTRALLVAQSGLFASKQPTLVAYSAAKR